MFKFKLFSFKEKNKKIVKYSFILLILILINSCGKYGKLQIDNIDKTNKEEEQKLEIKTQKHKETKNKTQIDYYDNDFVF